MTTASLQRILILAFVTLTTSCALGVLAAYDFSDKTVAQLLELLESNDRAVREHAAFYLGYRYRKPGVQINPPTYKKQHPEFPLSPQAVQRLAEHLKSDSVYAVRIAAMRALTDLRSCTNTTSLVAAGLEDTNSYVRVWTCSALIYLSHDYSEPLVAKIIPTLRQCLSDDNEEEPTWIAAWISGQLGDEGKSLLPELQKLAKHKSSMVRDHAREAQKSILQEKKRTG